MHGNVWEITEACAAAGRRGAGCGKAVVRGGSFQSAPDELRAANRFTVDAGKRRQDVGLRVVRDLDAEEAAAAT
jgi:formylglycine-generating enzyme required for sulfatase activity